MTAEPRTGHPQPPDPWPQPHPPLPATTPYGQSPYGQSPDGQSTGGQPLYSQPAGGQLSYGQAGGQLSYGQSAGGQSPYGQPFYGAPGEVPGYPQPFPAVRTLANQAPSVGPVIAFTLLFGLFGAISAARRADRARTLGFPGRKYWIAFGATLAAGCTSTMIVFVASLAMGTAFTTVTSHKITSAWLQESIVQDGTFRNGAGGTVKANSATCAADKVDTDGAGAYRCTIGFADGDRESFVVTVDATGKWTTGSGT